MNKYDQNGFNSVEYLESIGVLPVIPGRKRRLKRPNVRNLPAIYIDVATPEFGGCYESRVYRIEPGDYLSLIHI